MFKPLDVLYSTRSSRNSEAFASEFPENMDEAYFLDNGQCHLINRKVLTPWKYQEDSRENRFDTWTVA